MPFCTAKTLKESWHSSLDNPLVMKSSHQLPEGNNKTKLLITIILSLTMISPLKCIEHLSQPKKTVKMLLKHMIIHYVNVSPKEQLKSTAQDQNHKTNRLIYIPIKCPLNSDPPPMVSHHLRNHLRKSICSITIPVQIH